MIASYDAEARRSGSSGTRASTSGRPPRSRTATRTRSSGGSAYTPERATCAPSSRGRPTSPTTPARDQTRSAAALSPGCGRGTRASFYLDPAIGTYYVFLNTRLPPFDNVEGPAGGQLRGRPQPAGRARRRPGSRTGRAARCCRRTSTATGATAPTRSSQSADGSYTGPDLAQGPAARRRVGHEGRGGDGRQDVTGIFQPHGGDYFVSVLRSLGYRARFRNIKDVDTYFAAVGRLAAEDPGRHRRLVARTTPRRATSSRPRSRATRSSHARATNYEPGRVLQPSDRRRDRPRPLARDHRPRSSLETLETRSTTTSSSRLPGCSSRTRPRIDSRLPPRRQLPVQPAMASAPRPALGEITLSSFAGRRAVRRARGRGRAAPPPRPTRARVRPRSSSRARRASRRSPSSIASIAASDDEPVCRRAAAHAAGSSASRSVASSISTGRPIAASAAAARRSGVSCRRRLARVDEVADGAADDLVRAAVVELARSARGRRRRRPR